MCSHWSGIPPTAPRAKTTPEERILHKVAPTVPIIKRNSVSNILAWSGKQLIHFICSCIRMVSECILKELNPRIGRAVQYHSVNVIIKL